MARANRDCVPKEIAMTFPNVRPEKCKTPWVQGLRPFWPILLLAGLLIGGCADGPIGPPDAAEPSGVPIEPTGIFEVPFENRWGIYSLDLSTQKVDLIFSSAGGMAALRLNPEVDRFVFSMKVDGDDLEHTEIFTIAMDGSDLQRLTDNSQWDVYPAWSPDGKQIAYLSWRDSSLDIYIMQADGSDQKLLFDSGGHDADIHWLGDRIAFTRDSQIWIMMEDGSGEFQLTDPPGAGEWGDAVLPFGDYDPRISPDGSRVIFSRMVDDRSPHGNYDLLVVNSDGSNEALLSGSGYTQGLSSWSHSGDQILFIVSAIEDLGKYDLYVMNEDGTGIEDITPAYFPDNFLCHWGIFGRDDSKVYFLGEWWQGE
jgi:Tol biopolymer transport system component